MAVSNGQNANQTTFNNAFVSKTVNSTTIGQVSLANADTSSGDPVTNIQREFNSLSSFLGKALNLAKDVLPTWTNNETGLSTDSIFTRLNNIATRMQKAGGHTHDGTDGNGSPISALSLINFVKLYGMSQRLSYTDVTNVSGTSFDFSTLFNDAGKTDGGSFSTKGVFTSGSFRENIVRIRYKDVAVTNAAGLEIYGRFNTSGTFPTITWEIQFFVMDPGVGETSETMPSLDASTFGVDLFFAEIFDISDKPVMTQELTNLVPLGGSGGGSSGGGGSALTWSFDSGNAPSVETQYNQLLYVFGPAFAQEIYAAVKVPTGYVTGTPITLNLKAFGNGTNGADLLMQCESTLIVAGGLITDTTYQHTSTNAVITPDSLEVADIEIDITDGSGDIGSSGVTTGDLILIRLYRGTDDADGDILVLPSTMEIQFT